MNCDTVISEFITEGTHAGEWLGMKPTGTKLRMYEVDIDKLTYGEIIENCGAVNTFEALLVESITKGVDIMLEKVNLKKAVDSVGSLYVYDKVGRLNSHVLSVVNVENRTLDFHVHEASDELFYVIEGGFHLETEGGLIEIIEGELIIVPKGMRHRPVVKELTKFLMIELDGTLNKENSGDLFEG